MITPGAMITELLSVLNDADNLVSLGITAAVEASEDANEDLTPPYIIVYADFTTEAKLTDDGTPNNIPVDIKVVCVSGEYKKASEAFSAAFIMAVKVIRLLQTEYEIEAYDQPELPEPEPEPLPDPEMEYALLKCRETPLTIGRKSAAISTVMVNFYYEIPLMQAV